MTTQLGDKRSRKDWLHFIPSMLWLGYSVLYFSQPEVFKYNDSIGVMQLDIPYLEIPTEYTGDPVGIRDYLNNATIFLSTILLAYFVTTDNTCPYKIDKMYHFLQVNLLFHLLG